MRQPAGCEPAAILVSPRDYDRLVERMWFATAVEEGLSDSEQGRLVEDAVLKKDVDVALRNPRER